MALEEEVACVVGLCAECCSTCQVI